MTYQPQPVEVYEEIADKVRSGEYFRESRMMYDLKVHDMMAERYFYVLITTVSALIFLLAVFAARSLYPLEVPVPFIYKSNDIVEDMPRITPLRAYKGEVPGDAVLRFLVQNYVRQREDYDIATLDRNMGSVKALSAKEVYEQYDKWMDTRNPESPVVQYQRHSKRRVYVLSANRVKGSENEIEVLFEAVVDSKTEEKRSRWVANITFSYSGVELDQTGKPKPLSFLVTQYRVKRLQDG